MKKLCIMLFTAFFFAGIAAVHAGEGSCATDASMGMTAAPSKKAESSKKMSKTKKGKASKAKKAAKKAKNSKKSQESKSSGRKTMKSASETAPQAEVEIEEVEVSE